MEQLYNIMQTNGRKQLIKLLEEYKDKTKDEFFNQEISEGLYEKRFTALHLEQAKIQGVDEFFKSLDKLFKKYKNDLYYEGVKEGKAK